jgi:tetratricopeptide (TPR) repeat protein
MNNEIVNKSSEAAGGSQRMAFLLLLVIFLAGMIGSRVYLDHTPEHRSRERSDPMSGSSAPPANVIGAYVGTMVLGGLKSVAINMLWMRWSTLRSEKKHFEMIALGDVINALQPYNEEVWSYIAWEMAYNISIGEHADDTDLAWEWVSAGLDRLEDGARTLPDSIYLYYQRAEILMRRLMQKDRDGVTTSNRDYFLAAAREKYGRSPFTEARDLLTTGLAKFDSLETDGGVLRAKSPMGLYIYPMNLAAMNEKAYALDAWLSWRRGEYTEALDFLEKARQASVDLREYEYSSARLSRGLIDFYERLRLHLAVLLDVRARREAGQTVEEEALQGLWLQMNLNLCSAPDLEYADLWEPEFMELNAWVGGDLYENNNQYFARVGMTEPGEVLSATIGPVREDVDWYDMIWDPEKADRIRFTVTGNSTLRARWATGMQAVGTVTVLKPGETAEIPLPILGGRSAVQIVVECPEDVGEWGGDGSYTLEYISSEPDK